ncbi:Uncharacterised protein [Vibrio cholerae]|nr:Uncharacterised protein [Vibrio cholerae]
MPQYRQVNQCHRTIGTALVDIDDRDRDTAQRSNRPTCHRGKYRCTVRAVNQPLSNHQSKLQSSRRNLPASQKSRLCAYLVHQC